MFIGYPFGKKGWQVYDLEAGEFFITRDVVFHENSFSFMTREEKKIEELLPHTFSLLMMKHIWPSKQ